MDIVEATLVELRISHQFVFGPLKVKACVIDDWQLSVHCVKCLVEQDMVEQSAREGRVVSINDQRRRQKDVFVKDVAGRK